MKKQRILITGSAGFMGSHLYDYIFERLKNKYDIYGVDDLSGGFMRNVSQPKFFIKLDLRDRKKTADYIARLGPRIVFHLAADATEGRSQFTPFSALDRNLVAYKNVLIPSIRHGLEKMILISSMSVYGKQQTPFRESMAPAPEDIYGITKAAMEQVTRVMSQVYGFKYVIIRPHNVYGPRQNFSDPYRNVIGIFINSLMRGKNFYVYGDGEQKRAFSYIDDITPAIAKAGFSSKCENKIINLGSDEAVSLNELAELVLREFFNGAPLPRHLSPKYLKSRPQEVKYAFCAHDQARRLLGHKARISLKNGIRNSIAWAASVGPQKLKYIAAMDLDHEEIPRTWTERLY